MKAWISLGLLACIPALATITEKKHSFAVKTEHLLASSLNKSIERIETKQTYSLVKLTDDQVQELTMFIHEKEKNCGGVVDLSVDEESFKIDAKSAFTRFINAPAPKEQTYVIDNLESIKPALNHLSKESFQSDWTAFTSFPNRFANNQNGVDAALWLKSKAEQYAADYGNPNVEAKLYDTPRYKQASVVVRIPGKDSSLPAVLLGGHMDTYSGDKPGVDDDASGTIATLEVLRAVLASKLQFQRDIYFAFYAAEEWGLYGSKKVANDFKIAGTPMLGIMQLDMISYSKNAKHIFTFVRDYTNDNLTNFSKDLAKKYLDLKDSEIGDTKCGYGCSDHASWHKNGVAAVTPFESAMDDMNHELHTPRDTMAIADLDHAFRFVQLAFSFIGELADPLAQ